MFTDKTDIYEAQWGTWKMSDSLSSNAIKVMPYFNCENLSSSTEYGKTDNNYSKVKETYKPFITDFI